MPPILVSPLVRLALGALGTGIIVRWVVKEARRINAELDGLAAAPVFTGEQGFFWTLEPRAPAALHKADEVLMDFPLQRLEPLDVLRLLRQERVEHGLVLTGDVEPALDAELLHQLGKAERAADHPDGAKDG